MRQVNPANQKEVKSPIQIKEVTVNKLTHDEGPYHAETSLLLIYRANQWTGFYMIGTSAKKELMHLTLQLLIVKTIMEAISKLRKTLE